MPAREYHVEPACEHHVELNRVIEGESFLATGADSRTRCRLGGINRRIGESHICGMSCEHALYDIQHYRRHSDFRRHRAIQSISRTPQSANVTTTIANNATASPRWTATEGSRAETAVKIATHANAKL